MNKLLVNILLAAALTLPFMADARCCRRGSLGVAAAGFFAGALIGTAASGSYNADMYAGEVYYIERPYWDNYYPGAPRYALDYPTYAYAPIYTYAYDTRFGAPGGYYGWY